MRIHTGCFNHASLFLLCMICTSAFSGVSGDPREQIIGKWTTAGGRSRIHIFRTGDEYRGTIVWIRDSLRAGKPVMDDKNADEALRNRPLLGMPFLTGFAYDEDGVWKGGTIYDPESGKTYRAKITLVDEKTLELRGYIGIPLLGRTETWTRFGQGSNDPRVQILGEWTTVGGSSRVHIFRAGDEYRGTIIWIRDSLKAGKPVTDDKNADEALRNRPILGMPFLTGFAYDDEGVWKGGTIYDPESGKTYKAKITLVDEGTLELRGYIGIPLLGRTETWTR